MNKNNILRSAGIFILALFMISSAKAEYYIVYPASTSVAPCYSCAAEFRERVVYRTSYVKPRKHYHKRHYTHYKPHRHRSSASISVYYLVSPCGCVSGCNYVYDSCRGCHIMQEAPCPNDNCYYGTSWDRRTYDDRYADLQVTGY